MSKNKQITAMAIDDGSGNIATLFTMNNEKNESISPSCVAPSVLADLNGGISEQAWETEEGNRFTVTINHNEQVNTCTKEYQLSEANRVLIHNAIAQAVGSQPVYLGCTLPTAQFYTGDDSNPVNTVRIDAKRDNVMKAASNITGVLQAPVIAGVKVFPEAIPAYVYCSQDADGNVADGYPEEHLTLVVDLGRFTCDMALVSTGYQIQNFLTTENGVHKLADKFRQLLNRHAEEFNLHDTSSFSDNQIDQIINLGFIGSTLETESAIANRKDVSHLVNEAKEYLSKIIFSDIKGLVKDLNMLTRIIFVGGGANWLNEQSKEWFHTVEIPAQPELAIVRGTYIMLKPSVDALNSAPKAEEKTTEEAEA